MDFEVGQRVADYEIGNLIGVGGMGRVYCVRNTISHRTEAMKVLLSDQSKDPESAARFLSEIRTLAALDHPHIAQLHTAMQTGSEFIMMMEFVEGSSLQQLAAQGALEREQIINYMHQVLSALSFAHSRGVIHRDIKPANIMITPEGSVKLTDFGIAKSKRHDELTRPGTTVGSLNYMAPEQALGVSKIDGRADLYSLGITMYELFVGQKPFEDESAYVVLHRQLNVKPRPPVEVNPLLPQRLSDLILRALEKDPLKRFQNAAAFSHALHEVTGIAASTPVRSYTALSFGTRTGSSAMGAAAAQVSTLARSRARLAAEASAVVGVLVLTACSVPHFLSTRALAKISLLSMSRRPLSRSVAADRVATAVGQTAARPPVVAAMTGSHAEAGPSAIVTASGRRDLPRPVMLNAGVLPAEPNVSHQSHKSGAEAVTSSAPLSPRRERSAEPRPARVEDETVFVRSLPQAGGKGLVAASTTVAELQQLRDQTTLLEARAATLRNSVQRLKSQREAAGDGLDQNVANAYVRMNAYLDAGKGDLEDGDASAARDHLEKAKVEENTLDKLFNQ